MNTEQLKTDRTALEILKFRMVERLRIDQPSWTEELCSKKVNDFLDEEDPNLGECFTTAMQDFASQEIQRDRESRWINRTDRLPEPKDANRLGEVLSLDDKGIVTTIHFNNVRGFDQYTFWQPLPEPPKQLTP